jgi:hypothetical protein
MVEKLLENRKGFKKTIFIVLLIIIASILQSDFIPDTRRLISGRPGGETAEHGVGLCPETSVFYEYNHEIWKCNPRTGEKKKALDGSCPTVSPDKAKVAYTLNGNICLFDVINNRQRILSEKDYENTTYSCYEIKWSPDGKHLIADSGTYIIRPKTVINSGAGKIVAGFLTYNEDCEWIDNTKIVFTDLTEYRFHPKIGQVGIPGVAVIDVNGKKDVIKRPNYPIQYNFVQLLPGERICFSGIGGYWTMDKNGKNVRHTAKPESMSEKIKKIIPHSYNYEWLTYAAQLTKCSRWVIFNLHNKTSDEIYVINMDYPDSIKKIVDGTHPSW